MEVAAMAAAEQAQRLDSEVAELKRRLEASQAELAHAQHRLFDAQQQQLNLARANLEAVLEHERSSSSKVAAHREKEEKKEEGDGGEEEVVAREKGRALQFDNTHEKASQQLQTAEKNKERTISAEARTVLAMQLSELGGEAKVSCHAKLVMR